VKCIRRVLNCRFVCDIIVVENDGVDLTATLAENRGNVTCSIRRRSRTISERNFSKRADVFYLNRMSDIFLCCCDAACHASENIYL